MSAPLGYVRMQGISRVVCACHEGLQGPVEVGGSKAPGSEVRTLGRFESEIFGWQGEFG